MLGKGKKKKKPFSTRKSLNCSIKLTSISLFAFPEDRVELHWNTLQNQHKKLFIFLLSLKYMHNITEVLMLWILHVFNEKMGMWGCNLLCPKKASSSNITNYLRQLVFLLFCTIHTVFNSIDYNICFLILNCLTPEKDNILVNVIISSGHTDSRHIRLWLTNTITST